MNEHKTEGRSNGCFSESRTARGTICGPNGLLALTLTVVASALLLVSLKLPLWQMRLEAPQYRDKEALHVAVHPNAFRGDLKELTVLEQYIGVHIPSTLPQFKWMPGLLVGGAVLGIAVCVLGIPLRSRALAMLSCALAVALALAAVQATGQIRDIGHKRDQKTVLAGVKDFTPPFVGTNKIAQFTVNSRFGLGAWLIGAGLSLQLSAAWLGRRSKAPARSSKILKVETRLSFMPAASRNS